MNTELKRLYFFENWYIMAEGRDTDTKRLAFYDAIMRYAFDGIVPDAPVRGKSKGEVWAAWDGYNACRPIVDSMFSKIRAGKAGGLAGKGVSRNAGNANAKKTIAPINSTNQKQESLAETIAIKEKEKEECKEKEEIKEKERVPPVTRAQCRDEGSDGCSGVSRITLPTEDEMRIYARQIDVPEEYIPSFIEQMRQSGWGYVNRGGNYVQLNRRNFKAVLRAYYDNEKRKSDENNRTGNGKNRVGIYVEGIASGLGV